MRFFVGLHQPSDAKHFERSFISVNRLRARQSDFAVKDWILDSGAFSTVSRHGGYPDPVAAYAKEVLWWAQCGNLLAAVAEDYMCEPTILAVTGKSVREHQQLTIGRYDALVGIIGLRVPILPVLQGYAPTDYVDHLQQYGHRVAQGQWVGVGSVCKRNGHPRAVLEILLAIKSARPDLRLHGFGLKTTALADAQIRRALESADSMSWSFSARRQGRDGNSWREAQRYVTHIENMVDSVAAPSQQLLPQSWSWT